jgi:hypothetical protein
VLARNNGVRTQMPIAAFIAAQPWRQDEAGNR